MPAAAPSGVGRPLEVVIVSNGHGEDVIGASLAGALLELAPTLRVRAFPLVDDGAAYDARGIDRLGPCRTMPSGGFMMHSPALFLSDVRAGFVGMTLRQMAGLARLRCDVLVVVGDVYGQALATLARARFRAVLQPLVSARHFTGARPPAANRFFMERLSYPERALMRHRAAVVYARDEPTALWLRRHGVPHAAWLGNPMMDGAGGTPLSGLPPGPVVALLPGSRRFASRALVRMAEALVELPGAVGLVAWSGGALPELPGWVAARPPASLHGAHAFEAAASRLIVVEGRFGDVLASARVALGTAGTAQEQAAGVGLPVVSFPLEPHYTRAFLNNQKRLLGEALTVVEGTPGAVATALRRLLRDDDLRARLGSEGARRMGPAGGSARIAHDLLRRSGTQAPPVEGATGR